VSTPGQGGEGPRYDPYAGRGSGGGQQGGPGQPGGPGAYGSPPPYGQPGQYAYNPYAPAPYPAGLGGNDAAPVRRPGIMVLSLVLLVLSTLVFLLAGVVLLALPLDEATVAPLVARLDPQNRIDPGQLIAGVRILGGAFAALSLLYIVFAVLAFTGRGWARIVVTVMTAGLVLLLAGGLVNGAAAVDATSLAILGLILAASVVGTVILFLPGPRAYFAARRR
jgi:hypothetical protein